MEQMQTNMMLLNMVQSMAQQTVVKSGAENAKSASEPSEFQKELEQQTQAAKTEDKPTENVKAETTQRTDKPAENDESMEQELQSAQELARQAAQAGLIWADMSAVAVEQPVEAESVVLTDVSAVMMTENAVVQEIATRQSGVNAQNVENRQDIPAELTAMESGETETAQVQVTMSTAAERADNGENTQMQNELTSRQTVQNHGAEKLDSDEVQITGAETGHEVIFRDVKEVMVKVGEAPATERSESVNMEEQITGKLTEALNLGESKVEIHLTPESLGSVTVELKRSGDGTLSVILSAESSRTGSLLEKHTDALQNFLLGNGQERVQVEVHNAQESQQHQQQDFADGRNGNQEGRQQEQHQREQTDAQDFLQQLRLGLVSLDGEAS